MIAVGVTGTMTTMTGSITVTVTTDYNNTGNPQGLQLGVSPYSNSNSKQHRQLLEQQRSLYIHEYTYTHIHKYMYTPVFVMLSF